MKRTLMLGWALLWLAGAGMSASAQFTVTTITAIQDGSGGFTAGTESDTDAGDLVEVTGIVTAVGGGGASFNVQEAAAPYAGIRVYPTSAIDVSSLAVGDNVTVQGNYIEYYGCSEIHCGGSTAGSVTVNSTGNTVYSPIVIQGTDYAADNAADTNPAEQYEGVLIRINGVLVVQDSLPHSEVAASVNGATVQFDDDFTSVSPADSPVGPMQNGLEFDVIGIGFYTYDLYNITPRTPSDIIAITPDTTPPELVGAEVLSLTTVRAVFNEVMGATGLTTNSNYSIDNGIGNPTAVSVDGGGDSVTLTVSTISAGVTYTLTVSNVVDAANNVIAATANTASFSLSQVTINEIMYDSLSVGLVPDKEWIELHNTTTSAVDIGGWALTDDEVFPPLSETLWTIPGGTILPASGYLVIAATSAVNIPGAIIADVTGLGALGNSGDEVSLWDGTGLGANLVDGSLTVMYPDLSTGNSGNSIEKVEENLPWSGSPAAWQEASVPAGVNPAEFNFASPGRKNGTFAQGVTGLANWSDYR